MAKFNREAKIERIKDLVRQLGWTIGYCEDETSVVSMELTADGASPQLAFVSISKFKQDIADIGVPADFPALVEYDYVAPEPEVTAEPEPALSADDLAVLEGMLAETLISPEMYAEAIASGEMPSLDTRVFEPLKYVCEHCGHSVRYGPVADENFINGDGPHHLAGIFEPGDQCVCAIEFEISDQSTQSLSDEVAYGDYINNQDSSREAEYLAMAGDWDEFDLWAAMAYGDVIEDRRNEAGDPMSVEEFNATVDAYLVQLKEGREPVDTPEPFPTTFIAVLHGIEEDVAAAEAIDAKLGGEHNNYKYGNLLAQAEQLYDEAHLYAKELGLTVPEALKWAQLETYPRIGRLVNAFWPADLEHHREQCLISNYMWQASQMGVLCQEWLDVIELPQAPLPYVWAGSALPDADLSHYECIKRASDAAYASDAEYHADNMADSYRFEAQAKHWAAMAGLTIGQAVAEYNEIMRTAAWLECSSCGAHDVYTPYDKPLKYCMHCGGILLSQGRTVTVVNGFDRRELKKAQRCSWHYTNEDGTIDHSIGLSEYADVVELPAAGAPYHWEQALSDVEMAAMDGIFNRAILKRDVEAAAMIEWHRQAPWVYSFAEGDKLVTQAVPQEEIPYSWGELEAAAREAGFTLTGSGNGYVSAARLVHGERVNAVHTAAAMAAADKALAASEEAIAVVEKAIAQQTAAGGTGTLAEPGEVITAPQRKPYICLEGKRVEYVVVTATHKTIYLEGDKRPHTTKLEGMGPREVCKWLLHAHETIEGATMRFRETWTNVVRENGRVASPPPEMRQIRYDQLPI